VDALRAHGFVVEVPKAAMYVWIALPSGIASADFSSRALEEEGVVTMAGSGFGPGGEGFFRIALTQPAERIREAVARLGRTLAACRDTVAAAHG
jgi:LL-diaminopimelate aminotransferase